ncbi:hypothetical protein BBI01_04130 [Chryseobacterium artocarpi]|uniref:Uncharacterized protein n=1 Tax=Chryseobacterium artocarpi TaxID=1414727 RepID=A0A1B8ZWE1_9FLAO|nr:hypothetical protein [Chryseobacterium artocarpi]OCA75893.1 hypothetical protein BBI01_04130 [Chryseobacterium artocarpi]
MKKQFKNWTLFFILGLVTIVLGVAASIVMMTSVSAPDTLYGMFILLWMIPVALVVIIDRILVRKFGNKRVNKIQFSILLLIVLLWILRAALNLIYS